MKTLNEFVRELESTDMSGTEMAQKIREFMFISECITVNSDADVLDLFTK